MASKQTPTFILYSLNSTKPNSSPVEQDRFNTLSEAWPFAVALLKEVNEGTHVYVKLPNGFEFSPVPEGGWTGRMSAVA